jgi:hypothetical protein
VEQPYEPELIGAFEEVKEAVRKAEGTSRAGLMLGLQELGTSPTGLIGGYHQMWTNLIVLNKTSLRRLWETNPGMLRPYAFHVLLHEYIHSLGCVDEEETRERTLAVTLAALGEGHPATDMARDIRPFFPDLVYPGFGWTPQEDGMIELVRGFDRASYSQYIT